MPLINCHECGGTVSTNAQSCLHCGQPIEKTYCPECKGEVTALQPLSNLYDIVNALKPNQAIGKLIVYTIKNVYKP